MLVEIDGTNFRLPTVEATGKTTEKQAVRVFFGTVEALRVSVVSSTLLRVLIPIHDFGTVDVSVRNVTDAGADIAGESATLADGFTYVAPRITHEYESDLTRMVRTLIREIKRQVLPDRQETRDIGDGEGARARLVQRVSLATHTDYDEETGTELRMAKLSELPGIVLRGPDLVENRFYSENENHDEESDGPAGEVNTKRAARTCDLLFQVIGVTNNEAQSLNLMNAMTNFMRFNTTIAMLADPDDESKGMVEFELDFQQRGDFVTSPTVANESNIRTFEGRILIRGFHMSTSPEFQIGAAYGMPAQDVEGRTFKNTQDVVVDEFLGVYSGTGAGYQVDLCICRGGVGEIIALTNYPGLGAGGYLTLDSVSPDGLQLICTETLTFGVGSNIDGGEVRLTRVPSVTQITYEWELAPYGVYSSSMTLFSDGDDIPDDFHRVWRGRMRDRDIMVALTPGTNGGYGGLFAYPRENTCGVLYQLMSNEIDVRLTEGVNHGNLPGGVIRFRLEDETLTASWNGLGRSTLSANLRAAVELDPIEQVELD